MWDILHVVLCSAPAMYAEKFISVINLRVCTAAVETSDGHSCHGSGKQALPLPSGFLLGPVRSTGLGSSPASCVHVVSAADGQRINLTLYDFGAYATPVVNSPTNSSLSFKR